MNPYGDDELNDPAAGSDPAGPDPEVPAGAVRSDGAPMAPVGRGNGGLDRVYELGRLRLANGQNLARIRVLERELVELSGAVRRVLDTLGQQGLLGPEVLRELGEAVEVRLDPDRERTAGRPSADAAGDPAGRAA